MDHQQKFASDQNVTRFVSALQTEADPMRRNSLRSLLLEEENRLGSSLEQLDKADRYLGEFQAHISRLLTLIGKLRADGHDASPPERLLNNMTELHQLFVSYRQIVVDALNRNKL
jgi:hypothetical protein